MTRLVNERADLFADQPHCPNENVFLSQVPRLSRYSKEGRRLVSRGDLAVLVQYRFLPHAVDGFIWLVRESRLPTSGVIVTEDQILYGVEIAGTPSSFEFATTSRGRHGPGEQAT